MSYSALPPSMTVQIIEVYFEDFPTPETALILATMHEAADEKGNQLLIISFKAPLPEEVT